MRVCKVEGCDGKVSAKGYCQKHYMQYRKYGEALAPVKEDKLCGIEGCTNKYCCKGYCNRHYQQYKRCGHILERTTHDLNEIIEYDDYAEIVLYDKDNIEVGRALIDIEDVNKVKNYKWRLNEGYIYNRKIGLLHRFLMNPSDNEVVDHINHNPFDNRRCNLRICTAQQNSMNRLKHKRNTTSKYKGVYFNKQINKWSAQIYINNKRKSLGYYTDELEASIEYDKAALLYHGIYANINHDIENYTDYIVNELGLDINDFNK